MILRVDCQPGRDGAPEPATVWFGSRRVPVRAVVDRWYGADRSWWKLDTDDGQYVLRLDESSGAWDLAAVVRGD